MAPTTASKQEVFRSITQQSFQHWPAYRDFPAYDRTSLAGLGEDVRTVAEQWFRHDQHDDIDEFVCELSLAYFEFSAHDHYPGRHSDTYTMEPLVRAFLLKEMHGWSHETALEQCLEADHTLAVSLGFETIPDQSTLWRSWHRRFTADLRKTVETVSRTILTKADRAGVAVPREPPSIYSQQETEPESTLDDRKILDRAAEITDHVSRIAYSAFSLSHEEGCEVHENAFWDLQTYLGLRENLAANEGARSFLHESRRERTPLGHARRVHLRDLSVDWIREMYQQAVSRLIDRVAETKEFYRAGIVAIDTTEDDPFTGDRSGHEDEIIGTKEGSEEYAYQWATVQLVGNAVPLILDARPVRKSDTRREVVEDLLDTAEDLVHVDKMLMDREFDSQHVLKSIANRGLTYVVPKRMQISEKAQARRLLQRNVDQYTSERGLHLGDNEWHETTLVYRRKENSDRTDYRQYAVFMTNAHPGGVHEYDYRWEIESGYKSIKRFMAATTSKNFVLRFFYFVFACLLYSIWRAVDLLVQIELTGEYERSPIITAGNTLTLLKKETGIG